MAARHDIGCLCNATWGCARKPAIGSGRCRKVACGRPYDDHRVVNQIVVCPEPSSAPSPDDPEDSLDEGVAL